MNITPIDIPAEYGVGQRIRTEPVVQLIDDFASELEVEHVRQAAVDNLRRAHVSFGETGKESPGRTGSNCWVHLDHDPVISDLAQRIAALVGIPLRNAESMQVVHYGPSQQYAPHFDAWDHDSTAGKRCLKRGGQRLVTGLLYLNEVQGGGGTIFPRLDVTIEPRKGRLLLFHNCRHGTNERHPNSLHGGLPVESGEKWACNFWFRENSYNRSTTKPNSN